MANVSEAEKRWGYVFGVDGVVGRNEALTLLGVRSPRSLYRYGSEGLVRVGYRRPGKQSSGLVVDRRSIVAFNRSREK